ncbi:glycoside hydrolase [Phyllosticta citricarpa]|uniref:alpha-1,2-Mannosidase n=2 Tax=Phyllosticta TaxID=121621 RepID=A0ABR1MGH6_9PEZI
MHSFASLLLLLAPQIVGTLSYPQHATRESTAGPNKERADAVKEAFQFAWNGYYTYAFPNDDLHPISNTAGNSRNAWGASAVDALSTALVMGKTEVVKQILDYIPTIDYTTTATEVSMFETTIRYLGGMISSYELLTGPLKNLSNDTRGVQALLDQSVNLANALKFAFDLNPTGIPSNNIYFTNHSDDGTPSNGIATIGTLVLEWTRLSDLTGIDEYGQLTQKAESYLLNPQPAYNEPFPGLIGTYVGLDNGSFIDATGGWIGGDDSFYEYLIKMWVYDPNRFELYKDRWVTAVESSITYLASNPDSRPDLTYLAAYDNSTILKVSEHLACFNGGNFILGGNVLGREEFVDFGIKLVDGCRNTYKSTRTGIGPEVFSWNTTTLPANQSAFYEQNGFWIRTSDYNLRPEVLESYYYAYRQTKDPKYQEWAWEAFRAINASARRGSGFTSIKNVNVAGGGAAGDNQESFFFAETMKYAYLIFAEDAEYQVFGGAGGANEWVWNTEAHPVRIAASRAARRSNSGRGGKYAHRSVDEIGAALSGEMV